MQFGDNVRAMRRARNMKQGELAARAGVDQATISRIEHNKQDNPTMETVERLARALEIEPVELLHNPLAGPFPADQLRQDGLSEADIRIYSALWDHVALDKRAEVLGDARILAHLQTRRKQLQQEYDPHSTPVTP